MKCWQCEKEKTKTVCGACREVLKIDLVEHIMGMNRVYIDEHNRNNGRPWVIKDDKLRYQIWELHQQGFSYRQIEDKLGVSKSSVAKVVNQYKQNLGL